MTETQTIRQDWYRQAYDLSMQDSPWTAHTVDDVERVTRALGFAKGRVLDLACGYGRHAVELAKRGYDVVGVDLSSELIGEAQSRAAASGYAVQFLACDIRGLTFSGEFDAVLNLYDGAIGYLETDEENAAVFSVISRALKRGGKSIVHIHSADYARKWFPQQTWRRGNGRIELLDLSWDSKTGYMVERTILAVPGTVFDETNSVVERKRLYLEGELRQRFHSLGLEVCQSHAGLLESATPSDDVDYYSLVSEKL